MIPKKKRTIVSISCELDSELARRFDKFHVDNRLQGSEQATLRNALKNYLDGYGRNPGRIYDRAQLIRDRKARERVCGQSRPWKAE